MASIDDEIRELRARLAKLEDERAKDNAEAEAPLDAPASETLATSSAKSNRGLLIMVLVIGGFIAILVAATHSGSNQAKREQSAAQLAADAASTAPLEPVAPSPPAAPAAPSYAWVYVDDVDPMSDRKTLTACVNSSDEVALDAPYESVTARLCIRNSPKFGVDVFYVLNGDGQILCDISDGCNVGVRYGDAPAGRNGGTTSADHSSNIIFLDGGRAVAARLAKAKTTKIELTYYQAGVQSVTFPTEGLDLGKVGLGGGAKKKS